MSHVLILCFFMLILLKHTRTRNHRKIMPDFLVSIGPNRIISSIIQTRTRNSESDITTLILFLLSKNILDNYHCKSTTTKTTPSPSQVLIWLIILLFCSKSTNERTQRQLISSYLSRNDPNLSLVFLAIHLLRQTTTVLNYFQYTTVCFMSIRRRLYFFFDNSKPPIDR